MKAILLLAAILSPFSRAFGQYAEGWTETAVLIECPVGGGTNSFGSGFFLQYSNEIFLVTARHVLFDEKKLPALSLLASNATILSRSAITNLVFTNVIDLAASFALGETRAHPSRDIAAVRLQIFSTNGGAFVPTFLKEHLFRGQIVLACSETKRFADLEIGGEIVTFGYPVTIGLGGQIDRIRPLARRGFISDKDPNRRSLVLDSPEYGGNSGGPVVLRVPISKDGLLAHNHYVIGIVTQLIPFADSRLSNQLGNSGYSIAEPMDSVFELIEPWVNTAPVLARGPKHSAQSVNVGR